MKKYIIILFLCTVVFEAFSQSPTKANFVILNQADKVACNETTIQFMNKSTLDTLSDTTSYFYVWDYGDKSKRDTVKLKKPNRTHTYLTDGQFTVTLTIIDTSHHDSVVSKKPMTNIIKVYRPSAAEFTGSNKYDEFETFNYIFTVSDSFKPFDKTAWQYDWDFGDGKAESTDSTFIYHHFTAENKSPGYSVKLKIHLNPDKVTFSNADKVTACFDTIVVKQPVFDGFFKQDSSKNAKRTPLIPNIFTPNKDGFHEEIVLSLEDTATTSALRGNDFFVFKTNGEQIFSFWVYNRWGQLVYKTEGKTITWQGKSSSGDDLNSGVYYYVVESNASDKRHKTAGVIQLLRE